MYNNVTVTSALCDGTGDVLERNQATARSHSLALIAADCWARGALARADDPDAYVEHSFSTDAKTPPYYAPYSR